MVMISAETLNSIDGSHEARLAAVKAAKDARIAELERGLRLVRKQIREDHEMNLPTERAAQSLILADIDIALAGSR